MASPMEELADRFAACRGALFPGSAQVQNQERWTAMSFLTTSFPDDGPGDASEGSAYIKTAHHTDFDPEWPVPTAWPLVMRSLRRSLGFSQAGFAEAAGLGPATVERWETGRKVPFRGDALQLLTVVAPLVDDPVQRGQLLNVAAAAVLPKFKRPTATYTGTEIVSWLRSEEHDHTALGDALLTALRDARILIPVEETGNEPVDDTYFPLAGNLHDASSEPNWARDFLAHASRLDDPDRETVLGLMRRLAQEKA